MGVIERDRGTIYCSVLSFGSGGEFLGKHCKLMPTASERLVWGFGDGSILPVFDTPIGRVGTSNSGLDLLQAFYLSPCKEWQDYPPAPEYVIGGMGEGQPSPEDVVCAGGSVIISPSGTILAGSNFEGEGLITADLGKLCVPQSAFVIVKPIEKLPTFNVSFQVFITKGL
ncbi:unnamed protein product [Sphagnum compactum]